MLLWIDLHPTWTFLENSVGFTFMYIKIFPSRKKNDRNFQPRISQQIVEESNLFESKWTPLEIFGVE